MFLCHDYVTLLKHQHSIPWNKFAESSVAQTLSLPFIYQISSGSVFTGHIGASFCHPYITYLSSVYLSIICLSVYIYHHLSLAAILKDIKKKAISKASEKLIISLWLTMKCSLHLMLTGELVFCFPIWHSLLFPQNLYNDVPK